MIVQTSVQPTIQHSLARQLILALAVHAANEPIVVTGYVILVHCDLVIMSHSITHCKEVKKKLHIFFFFFTFMKQIEKNTHTNVQKNVLIGSDCLNKSFLLSEVFIS